MRNSTKGALAAGGAVLLLLGGAGSLAYWSDDAAVPGGTIRSGRLELGDPSCGAGWVLDGGAPYTTQLVVPGDTLTKTCTIDLIATGDHVGATLGIDTATWTTTNGLSGQLAASATFTVGGVTKTTVTDADDTGATDEITAVVTVTFTGASATNASQNLSATLRDVSITATQTHTP